MKGNIMKAIVLVCSVIILLLTSFNCKSPTAPNGSGISLTVADVSCTEAWLNLTSSNVTFPVNLTIKSGSSVLFNASISSSDSLIYINSLLPNHTYTLQGYITTNNKQQSTTNLTVKTLDTTSSNFTWQTYTFGSPAAGSSYLNDVSLINDTTIIAVGAVYLTDSTGKAGPFPYNLIEWDGNEWHIIRVPYYYQGQTFYHPIQSVFTFGSNDIFFCGNGVIHWDGTKYNPISIPTSKWGSYQINKIWGESNEDFYICGNNGSLAYNQNGTWQKIESGTTLPIQNIWGAVNSSSSVSQILCVASDKYYNQGNKFIEIKNNNTAIALADSGLPWSLSSVWFIPNRKYYIAGDGVFQTTSLEKRWTEVKGLPSIYTDVIRGTNFNNIVVSGSNGTLSYFNGVRWNNYINNPLPYISGRLVSVSIKDNTIAAVGFSGEQAYLVIGRR